MINELEMVVRCAPHLTEKDQQRLADAIQRAFEQTAIADPQPMKTIVF